MLIARHLLFYGLYNTENVMNEITHLPDSQKKICLENPTDMNLFIHCPPKTSLPVCDQNCQIF
jgi:hypothetical protein